MLINISLLLSSIIRVPEDYITIQNAINNSQDNDSILVNSGIYTENIFITNKCMIIDPGCSNKSEKIILQNYIEEHKLEAVELIKKTLSPSIFILDLNGTP